jgi:hypothetical protein
VLGRHELLLQLLGERGRGHLLREGTGIRGGRLRLETSFYEYYRAYYGAILGGMPLGVIEDRRRRMFQNLP